MKAERAYPSVAVTPKAEAAILRGHPWIYDAEILSMEGVKLFVKKLEKDTEVVS